MCILQLPLNTALGSMINTCVAMSPSMFDVAFRVRTSCMDRFPLTFPFDFGVGGDDIALNAGLLADDYFPGTFDIPLQ